MPKQFVKLFDNKSLFQLTLERNSNIADKYYVVSNIEQVSAIQAQVNETKVLDDKLVEKVIEPIGRNTAPAIALACFDIDPEEIVLVTPSDHLIKNNLEYKRIIKLAENSAQKGNIVTFGIKPSYPETGYGYIEANLAKEDNSVFNVHKFREKPDFDTAKSYLAQNTETSFKYLWNSGMFCFKAGVFLEELKKYAPEIYKRSEDTFKFINKGDGLLKIPLDKMQAIPSDSIDYAVLEHSNIVKVIPSDFDWSDLGSFEALDVELKKDENNNTKHKDLHLINSKNNFIISNKKVSLIDIEDLIIVETEDSLMISKKGSSQKVKQIVAKLDKKYK